MYNIKFTKLPFYLLLLVALWSCRKSTKTVPDVDYVGGTMVSFNNYSDDNGVPGYMKYETPLKDSFITAKVEVKLSNTTEAADHDIKVYFIKVDALVGDYNSTHGATLTALSTTSAGLNFDFSKPVIIKKGQRKASLPIIVNPLKFDLSKKNAIGIAIDHVEGASLNEGAESRLVIEFGARNKYDGVYQLRGFHNRPTFEAPYNEEVHMITTGVNKVKMFWVALGADAHPISGGASYYTDFTTEFAFNETTNVLIAVDNTYTPGSPPFAVGPATTSRYDPATKTIYAQYYYNANLQRMFTDTLRYIGPR